MLVGPVGIRGWKGKLLSTMEMIVWAGWNGIIKRTSTSDTIRRMSEQLIKPKLCEYCNVCMRLLRSMLIILQLKDFLHSESPSPHPGLPVVHGSLGGNTLSE